VAGVVGGSTAWWLSTKAPLRNVADSRIVKLRWAETGGPAVVEPARRGFGSRMIEPALAAETPRYEPARDPDYRELLEPIWLC